MYTSYFLCTKPFTPWWINNLESQLGLAHAEQLTRLSAKEYRRISANLSGRPMEPIQVFRSFEKNATAFDLMTHQEHPRRQNRPKARIHPTRRPMALKKAEGNNNNVSMKLNFFFNS